MGAEPREFGSYRLLRRLGVGGMAETFEAVRLGGGGFEQRVCLKRVLPAYCQDPTFVERFRKEAQVAANLRHSNIVGVTDFGEVDGVSYMALELVDGVDLRSFLRSTPEHKLTAHEVTWLGLDIAYALEHAHARIVHRDVSPSNVLVSRNGEAKLADFGIARMIETTTTSASRSMQGKVPYMAPEQIRGEPADPRSDLFSLGVVLFEAVSGVRPFDGAHDVVTMQRIVEGKHLDLAEVAPDVPTGLRECIERLLVVDLERRTPTAAALTECLAALDPPQQARRAFAARVEAQRGGPRTRMHVRARREEPDTEMSAAADLPATTGRLVEAPKRSMRRLTAWVAAAVGLLLAAGLFVVRSTSEHMPNAGKTRSLVTPSPGVPKTEIAPPATPPPATSAPTAAAARDESPRKSQSSDDATDTPDLGPGWLHVVVQPWGNVWIDGVWMGRAPVKARVARGRHVVEVGRDLPSKRRVVEVRPGTRRELELQLGE